MKKYAFLLPVAGALGVFLAACLSAPDEPTGSQTSGICTSSQKSFNGACHDICTSSSQCSSGDNCMTVSEGTALCLDYTQCGYFSSDTSCAGAPGGGIASSYGSYDDPYYTSSDDPYFSSDPYDSPTYTEGYGGYGGYGGYDGLAPYGCTGNGTWLLAPPLANDDPQCGVTHTVNRCQKVGNSCAIVNGSTIDVAEK